MLTLKERSAFHWQTIRNLWNVRHVKVLPFGECPRTTINWSIKVLKEYRDRIRKGAE